ncbi:hypothetical protein MHB77_17055 [Paenibacillus sp. FSL K6-3166]|uniref:hypothetical protein n=1 Tax=unclassified Paenibacillus TaxID=185978 RepID=UPI000BA0EF67|nr:hypothetical protein [Paenibacillus sp. VTT E-133291]OZQ91137.1 hypothetical protein CA598_12260 [Paenibacillus sp. VTT E-133291]
MDNERCYWCGNKANSMEHVPPKCLFPEEKDVKDILNKTYRNNLITVPSCDEHNLNKSNLDEYLMANLSGKVGNNFVAYVHTATKVSRSRLRNPKIIQIDKKAVLKLKKKEFPVLWITVDTLKLRHSFEAIARALYFYEYNDVFKGNCMVVSTLFDHADDPNGTEFNKRSSNLLESEQRHWKSDLKGNNPDIFTYQFSEVDGFKCQTLGMTFYEGTKVFVILNGMTETEVETAKTKLAFLTDAIFGDLN